MLNSPKVSANTLDGFLESYVRWRSACEDVEFAYDSWVCGPGEERNVRFGLYRAALDREEHAAHIHENWAQRLGALRR